MTEKLEFKGISTTLVQAVKDAVSSLKGFEDILKGQITTVDKYNNSSKLVEKRIEAVGKEGKKLNVILKEMKGELSLVNVTTRQTAESSEELEKKSRKAKEEIKRQKEEMREAAIAARQYRQELKQSVIDYDKLQASRSAGRGFTKSIIADTPELKTQDLQTQFTFKQQLVDLETLVEKHRISKFKIDKIWGELSRGRVNLYHNKLDRDLQGALIKVKTGVDNITNANKKLKESTDSITLSWRTMLRIVEIQLVRRAVSLFIRKLREGVDQSIKISRAIAEIQTISQQQPLIFSRWSKELLRVSDAFGIDIINQAEGAYQTLSNQIAEGIQTIGFLESANKLAVTSVSEVSDSVNALTAVLNAYGKSVLDTDDISAKLFKTVELGRVRLKEMSTTIGSVAVPAATLGVSFEELSALIATLTIRGINFSQAQTQIRGILLKLIKPTTAMKDLLEKWGFASGQAAIKALGFQGVLRKISEETGDSASELGELINRVRGLVGILSLTGRGREDYIKNLEEIQNATESYEKGFEKVITNLGTKLQIELNKISNFFNDLAVNKTLPLLDRIIGGIENLSKVIIILTTSLVGLISGGAVGLAISGVLKLVSAVKAITPVGAIITFIIGALTTLGTVYGTRISKSIELSNELRKKWEENWEAQAKIVEKALRKTIEDQRKNIDEREKNDLQALATVKRFINEELRYKKQLFRSTIDELEEFNKAALENTKKQIKEVEDSLKDVRSLIEEGEKAIEDLTREADIKIFELKLDDLDSAQSKIDLIKREVTSLREKSIQLVKDRDLKSLKDAQSRVRDLILQQRELEKETDEDIRDPRKLDKLRRRGREDKPISDSFKLGKKEIEKFTIDDFEKTIQEQSIQLQEVTDALKIRESVQTDELNRLNESLTKLESISEIFKIIPKDEDKIIESIQNIIDKIVEIQQTADDVSLENIKRQAESISKLIQQSAQNEEDQNTLIQEATRNRDQLAATEGIIAEAQSRNKEVALVIKALNDAIASAIERAKKSPDEEIKKLAIDSQLLAHSMSQLTTSLEQGTVSADEVASAVTKVEEFSEKIKDQVGVFGGLKGEVENSQDKLTELKNFYIENPNIFSQYNSSIDSQTQKLKNLNLEYNKLREQMGAIVSEFDADGDVITTGTTVQRHPRSRGTTRSFASGGSVPGVGNTDTVPAMLTPGEFVMNKEATKKFYTQLVNMNRIKGYDSGGAVTNNTSVGDINMNITSTGNIDYDLNKFARMYKRAINRGLLRV